MRLGPLADDCDFEARWLLIEAAGVLFFIFRELVWHIAMVVETGHRF